MICRNRIAAGLAALISCVVVMADRAEGHDHEDHKPGDQYITEHVFSFFNPKGPRTYKHSGYPYDVSHISMESYNERYSGSYVGGGNLFGGGQGRCAHVGTFGWDYSPFHPMSSHIFLGWSGGRRYQGGGGPYRTDGPKPIEHITEAVHGHFGQE